MNESDVRSVRLVEDKESLDEIVAERFVRAACQTVNVSGRFRAALSFDDTLLPVYELLATERYRSRLPWGKTEIFFTHERCVSSGYAESRAGRARRLLVEPLGLPDEQVHRIRGEATDLSGEAWRYEEALTGTALDLVLLALGTDGRLAALFPESRALRERERLALPSRPTEEAAYWLTLTPAAFDAAAAVWVVARGRECAWAVHEALEGEIEEEIVPAHSLRPRGEFLWLIDSGAAARLAITSKEVSERG